MASNPLTKWSYSQWATYKACPQQCFWKYVEKRPEISRPAADRGTLIHAAAEDFVKGKPTLHFCLNEGQKAEVKKDNTVELAQSWEELFDRLRKRKAVPEMNIALDSQWQPTDWFSKTAWFRAKMDCGVFKAKEVYSIDYKSGNVYEDHPLQVELYALGTFLLKPKVERVTAALWYLDKTPEAILEEEIHRDQLQDVLMLWQDRVSPMFSATSWPAKPGLHCRFCGYSGKKKHPDGTPGPCTKG